MRLMSLFLIAATLLLAACDVPVRTLTPSPPVTLTTIIPISTPSATLTLNAAPTVTVYPILLTVVPRAVSSISLRQAICTARHTQYQLWPYKLEIVFDQAGYQQCLEGGQP